MPVFAFKAIKPSRLKKDVFRKQLEAEAKKIGKEIKKDFELTTKTWKKKPKFEILTDIGNSGISILVGTDNEIYQYIDKGTKRHRVPKTGDAVMTFSPLYSPKTTPGVIGSTGGGAFGDKITRGGHWYVGGIEARNFDKILQKEWEPEFAKRMQAAMNRAAKQSGNSIK